MESGRKTRGVGLVFIVMAGLVPATHVFVRVLQGVDARHVKLVLGPAKGRARGAGHDDVGWNWACNGLCAIEADA